MITRIRFLGLMSALLLGTAACSTDVSESEDESVTAIDRLTGETREFPDEGSVPDGWTVCDLACPEPVPCEQLDEASCLVRSDCQPQYFGIGAYPKECEEPNPPDYCDGDAFAGCVAIDGSGGGGGGSGGVGGGSANGACDTVPMCELLCPEGKVHPIDDNGCEHTCECVVAGAQ